MRGAVLQLDGVFLPLFDVFVSATPTISTVPGPRKHKVPFEFAQSRLFTPRIVGFAMICSGWDDRIEKI